jgi:hypothetical protein
MCMRLLDVVMNLKEMPLKLQIVIMGKVVKAASHQAAPAEARKSSRFRIEAFLACTLPGKAFRRRRT